MLKKLFIILLVTIALIMSGCDADQGPIVISVDKTPVRSESSPKETPTPKATPTPTEKLTPEPTVKEESFKYIEDLELVEGESTLNLGEWKFGSRTVPFTISGQIYNKGIGMYIKSKDIDDEKGSVDFIWDLDKNFHRISFDLGCEENSQYDEKEKYGTYQITILADDTEIWDSSENDYKFTALDQSIDIPEGIETLTVRLTQTKGINGTLNVIMGSVKIYYYK